MQEGSQETAATLVGMSMGIMVARLTSGNPERERVSRRQDLEDLSTNPKKFQEEVFSLQEKFKILELSKKITRSLPCLWAPFHPISLLSVVSAK